MAKATSPRRAKNSKNDNDIDGHQWTVTFLRDQFQKESDRAAVILSASLIDEALTNLMRTHLVPCANAKDNLFDDANSPLANFSSKIDMSYRLGLISCKLARDIHLIRKIRNSFAHDVFGCDFTNGSVKARVMELKKSIIFVDNAIKEDEAEQKLQLHLKGSRGQFLFCSAWILWHINDLIQTKTHLKEAEEEGFLYTTHGK